MTLCAANARKMPELRIGRPAEMRRGKKRHPLPCIGTAGRVLPSGAKQWILSNFLRHIYFEFLKKEDGHISHANCQNCFLVLTVTDFMDSLTPRGEAPRGVSSICECVGQRLAAGVAAAAVVAAIAAAAGIAAAVVAAQKYEDNQDDNPPPVAAESKNAGIAVHTRNLPKKFKRLRSFHVMNCGRNGAWVSEKIRQNAACLRGGRRGGKMEPSGRCCAFKQLVKRAELVAQRLPAGKQLV